MISYIVPYRDCLLKEDRKENTIHFLKTMQEHLHNNYGLECIICDYGSVDGIKEYILENCDAITYLYVNPNEGQYLNISKCFNKAITVCLNNIIAPIGIDFRFDQPTIEQIIDMFRLLGMVVLRPHLIHMNENDDVESIDNVPYIIRKKNIYMSGGWDERFYDWGKEDDDIIQRIMKFQNLIQISIRGFGYRHVHHERSFSLKEEREVPMWRSDIMFENFETNGKNLVNSFWKKGN